MTSKIQNKLLNCEVPPPAGAWDSIAANLDNDAHHFPEKIYGFEVPPPPVIWQQIEEQLEKPEQGKVVPFFRRYHKPLKYSGVAAAIVVFGILGTLLIGKRTESETTAGVPQAVKTPAKRDNPKPSGPEEATNETAAVENTATSKTVTEKRTASRPGKEAVSVFSYADGVFSSPDDETEPVDKYMIFIDGDGNAMRLSRKLFNAFACAAYDYVCKQRISALQAKVASSAVTTDFTGILDMLKNLQENQ